MLLVAAVTLVFAAVTLLVAVVSLVFAAVTLSGVADVCSAYQV